MALTVRLLGPMELDRDGQTIPAGGPTQRAVLAMLALRGGTPVAVDELVDGIWGESDTSAGSERSLWTHISRLRTVLGSGKDQPLRRVPGGYRLDPDLTVDAIEFEHLLGASRQEAAGGEAGAAASLLDQALALWRGPALLDLRDFPFAPSVVARYDELRLGALEERIDARLAKGDDRILLPELHALVAEHPYRERLHGQLMVVLYRAGQQAAALEAYRAARGRLAADLGVEPGPELERLHREILQQADSVAPYAMASLDADRPAAVRGRTSRLHGPRVLFGRDDQLAELVQLADGARLLTLTGAGGTGKTALGLALVHRLASRFRDGEAIVDLGAVSHPEQVLPAIATALGVSQRGGDLGEQLALYLEEHDCLLLLDNLEHLPDVQALLQPLVERSSGLTVATSRSPLGVADEIVVDVPPLAVPELLDSQEVVAAKPAVQLFLHAATSAGGRVEASPEEIAAVARLCAAVDGLPLAIEIVAAQTRAEAPAELAAHLDERLPALRSRTAGAPDRQRTMDAAIGWSIDRLTVEQRDDLARLAAFAGSFTVSGAAHVLELGRARAIGLLTELLDASLLARRPSVAGQARFRLLQPIRGVARARAGQALLAEAATRHASYMASEIERLCPRSTGITRPVDLAVLRAEDPDLMAALRHLVTRSPTRGIELVANLEDFWHWTGREMDARRLADDALRGGRLSKRGRFIALGLRAMGAFVIGRVDEMRDALDQSVPLAAELGGDAVTAVVRLREARLAFMLEDRERGGLAGRAAVEHARRAREHRILALSLATRVFVETYTPEFHAWLQEALDLAEKESMAYTTFWVLGARSILLDGRGRYEEAMEVERTLLGMARRFQAMAPATIVMSNFADHLIQAGRVTEARAVVLAALTTADRIGHRIWAAIAVSCLGEVEAATGRWADALVLLAGARKAVARMEVTALYGTAERARLERLERWVAELMGHSAAAAALARADALSYRNLVDLARELNGIPATTRVPQDGNGGFNAAV